MNTLRNDLIKAELDIALCDMRLQLELIRLENHAAEREQSMGHWLSDHGGAIAEMERRYNEAKDRADATLAKLNADESPTTGSAEVDWSQAPEWAMWHAFDGPSSSGAGWYFQDQPQYDYKEGDWVNMGRKANPSAITKPANLAARDSLTRRPGK